jgi:hypothetical protein
MIDGSEGATRGGAAGGPGYDPARCGDYVATLPPAAGGRRPEPVES